MEYQFIFKNVHNSNIINNHIRANGYYNSSNESSFQYRRFCAVAMNVGDRSTRIKTLPSKNQFDGSELLVKLGKFN